MHAETPRSNASPMRPRARVVRLLAGLVLAALCPGCAPSKPPEKPPAYFRSPTLDYQDPPRSASDGEVMGANKQSVDDTLQASPTNEHPAPGWEIENGTLVPDRETRVGGHGSHASPPGCDESRRVSADAENTPAAGTPAQGDKAAENDKAAQTDKDKDVGRRALRPVCPKPKQ